MRRLGIVIAAIAALAMGAQPIAALAQSAKPPPITAKQREQGKAEAPAAIQAAKITCNVADAYLVQSGQDAKTKAKSATYEVACQEGPGYVLQTSGDTAQAFDCLALETAAKQNPKGAYTCRLDANLDTKAGFAKLAASGGHPCTATGARYIGSSGASSYYELACQDDKGYVLEVSGGKAPVVSDCISVLGGQLECTLTTKAQLFAGMTKLVAASGKPCTVSNTRMVGTDKTSGANYYEVACSGGPGYMIQANAQGGFMNAIECAKAQGIGGGCSLTVVDETAEAGTYTKLAQGAGFPCEVSKYRFLGKETKSNSEIVELACKNRPDGGIGMFPINGGKAQVFDCVQGGALGVSCQLTQPNLVYTKYTDRLVQAGKNQCKVTGAKYLASTTSGADLIETACSDGAPGFVISIDHASGKTNELLSCGQATRSGAACSLPTNVASAASATAKK